MTGDIQLPDMIDPESSHVEFRLHQCAEDGCRAHGPLTLVSNPAWFEWGDQHTAETGHKKFYQYLVVRNRGEMTGLTTPSRKRRPLGNRGA